MSWNTSRISLAALRIIEHMDKTVRIPLSRLSADSGLISSRAYVLSGRIMRF